MPNKTNRPKVSRNQNPARTGEGEPRKLSMGERYADIVAENENNAARENELVQRTLQLKIDSLERQLRDLQSEFIGKQMEVGEVRYEEKVHWAKVAARAMLRLNQYEGDFQPISTAKAMLGEAFLDAFPEMGNTGDVALIRFLGETFEEKEREFIITETCEYSVMAANKDEALEKHLSEKADDSSLLLACTHREVTEKES